MYKMNSIQNDSCRYLTTNEMVGYTRVFFMSNIKYNILLWDWSCNEGKVSSLKKKISNNKLKCTPFS